MLVSSSVATQPPMIADEVRRRADSFIELDTHVLRLDMVRRIARWSAIASAAIS